MSNKRKKIKKNFSIFLYKLRTQVIFRQILFFYLFITFLGTLLLMCPISQTGNIKINFIDALFTSASAFSDTGLVTSSTSETWSIFGQAIIAVLILTGGLGLFALKVYIINIIFFKNEISFREREVLSAERGTEKIGSTKNLIKNSITTLFIFIIIFSFILTLYFYFVNVETNFIKHIKYKNELGIFVENIPEKDIFHNGVPKGNFGLSLRYGIFHTISSINNAGFDIIGKYSLLGYYHNWELQLIFILLFVIGGLGFPVINDIILWIKSKFTKESFSFSLFSKISTITYFIVAVVGLGITFAFEIYSSDNNTIWNLSLNAFGGKKEKIMAIFFNTMSTRNAGFSTIPMTTITKPTILLYTILMFIGSSPSSTAGGIRTTTIAIIFISILKQLYGKKDVNAFNRRIPQETVNKAFIVFATAVGILIIGTMVSMTSDKTHGGEFAGIPLIYVLFEVSSAFGTTGLSSGITNSLSIASKLILILIMFIGQLGVSSTLLVWSKKNGKPQPYRLIKEDITIG